MLGLVPAIVGLVVAIVHRAGESGPQQETTPRSGALAGALAYSVSDPREIRH